MQVSGFAYCRRQHSLTLRDSIAHMADHLQVTGIDGVGFFNLCDQLLTYLSQPKPSAPMVGRKFPDIFDNMQSWMPMNITKQARLAVPNAYMRPLAADQLQEVVEPCFAAVWSELDENTTKSLLERYVSCWCNIASSSYTQCALLCLHMTTGKTHNITAFLIKSLPGACDCCIMIACCAQLIDESQS